MPIILKYSIDISEKIASVLFKRFTKQQEMVLYPLYNHWTGHIGHCIYDYSSNNTIIFSSKYRKLKDSADTIAMERSKNKQLQDEVVMKRVKVINYNHDLSKNHPRLKAHFMDSSDTIDFRTAHQIIN